MQSNLVVNWMWFCINKESTINLKLNLVLLRRKKLNITLEDTNRGHVQNEAAVPVYIYYTYTEKYHVNTEIFFVSYIHVCIDTERTDIYIKKILCVYYKATPFCICGKFYIFTSKLAININNINRNYIRIWKRT